MEGPANNERRRQAVAALRDALDVYVSGRSGVRFDALVRFAGPLFDLYDVEWRADDVLDALSRDEEELTTMLALLDTARLLWSFFTLEEERSLDMLPDLEDAMLGRGAGDEERSNLLVLLSLLEEHRAAFTLEERTRAVDTPGYALPEFRVLLGAFQDRHRCLLPRSPSTLESNRLELPEALALFAEPLLRDPGAEEDPDLVQERVERAQAYWDLATAAEGDFDERLEQIVEAFASTQAERSAIREEAQRMMARYKNLFADRSSGLE